MKATAEARSNIALIKYWGRRDHALNLPLTSSISLTLSGLVTTTTVEADPALKADEVTINGKRAEGAPRERVARHLDHLRKRAGASAFCRVASENNFASSAGLASSASAFAALTVAGFAALGAKVDAREMSAYARLGSGSAARSLYGGFVEWHAADAHDASFAEPLAPRDHMDVHDVAVTFSAAEKKVGSLEGHALADSSPLNAGRLARVPALLDEVRKAIRVKDFHRMGRAAEEDALLMHAVMMTSTPSLLYWRPETVDGLHAVREWRADGLGVYATIDAGPNLHLLCMGRDAPEVVRRVRERWPAADAHDAGPGEGARLVGRHLF
jgi:diphosphomevalonate decarboxylase